MNETIFRSKHHTVQNRPNKVLPGYYHVSEAGYLRSTLKYPGNKREGLGALSPRQRRKTYKRLRREAKEVTFDV